ncbi:replicative DNA helicase [Frankia sp. CcI49]|uniref:replicative DNA helicase n=1 Tax=Frankia sp. CcI49 TaxID=1745382 RepID=UPI0009773546|nr:replicative DNA helicase [Frankia sp. CcI49]
MLTAPPHDLRAEAAALGGCLMSTDATADVIEILSPGDFYRPAHATVYEAITSLFARGEPTDAISVAAELGRQNLLEHVGGPAYMHTLISSVPTAANAGYYARIVADTAILRRLAEAGSTIRQIGLTPSPEGAAEAIDRAEAKLYAATATARQAGGPEAPADSLHRTLDLLERLAASDGPVPGLQTGFAELDEMLCGLRGGQFIIVAARPAVGKSTLGLDIIRHATLRLGKSAILFSLEMSADEIDLRTISAEGRIPLQALRSGQLGEADWAAVSRVSGPLAASRRYVDTSTDTLMGIRSASRRFQRRHGLDLAVIDYAQLVRHGGRVENRQQEVSEISRSLKRLAGELDVPLVVLSQLNRASEQRADKRPQLSDLRESGSLEQDADIVILIHRPELTEDNSPRAGEADLIVAKNRNGPTGTVTVAFQGRYSRFSEMAA